MGAPRDEFGAGRHDNVQVQVTLTRPFEVGQFEVTHREWLAEGFELPLRNHDVGRCTEPDCPISNVNLYEIVTFINRYSENRGLPPCYELRACTGTFGSGPICPRVDESTGNLECERVEEDGLSCEQLLTTAASVYECAGYRLPTEAEWEYAARAGTRTAFWSGPITWSEQGVTACVTDDNHDAIGWYCMNSGNTQHPVGAKPPSPWGLYDTAGNVKERTAEPIHWEGYGEGPFVDPAGYWWDTVGKETRDLLPNVENGGVPVGTFVIERGGAYTLAAGSNTVSGRTIIHNEYQGSSALGFRLVRTLSEK